MKRLFCQMKSGECLADIRLPPNVRVRTGRDCSSLARPVPAASIASFCGGLRTMPFSWRTGFNESWLRDRVNAKTFLSRSFVAPRCAHVGPDFIFCSTSRQRASTVIKGHTSLGRMRDKSGALANSGNQGSSRDIASEVRNSTLATASDEESSGRDMILKSFSRIRTPNRFSSVKIKSIKSSESAPRSVISRLSGRTSATSRARQLATMTQVISMP